MARMIITAIAAVGLILCVALAGAASTGLLVQVWPIAPVLAARTAVAGLGLVLAVALLVLVGTRRTLRSRAPIPLPAATVLVLLVLLACLLLTTPGTTTLPAAVRAAARHDGLAVLTWNVRQLEGGDRTVASVIEQLAPDVVVLPELYAANLDRDGVRLASDVRYAVYGDPGIAVTVLVRRELGDYRVRGQDRSGAASGYVLEPEPGASGPRVVAVHLVNGSTPRGDAARRAGLEWVTAACDSSDALAVGDFNTAPVNLAADRLGDCRLGAGTTGTWPSMVPAFFGAPIDHVLASERWTQQTTMVLDIPATWTDHRAVLALLRRAGLSSGSGSDESGVPAPGLARGRSVLTQG